MTIPRCLFMHPNSIGASRPNHTTYIQNNFYGGSSNQSVWGCGSHQVMMRPQYYQTNNYCCNSGWMPRLPHWVQDAATRLMSFNLLKGMFNTSGQTDFNTQYQELYKQQQELMSNYNLTGNTLTGISNQYNQEQLVQNGELGSNIDLYGQYNQNA